MEVNMGLFLDAVYGACNSGTVWKLASDAENQAIYSGCMKAYDKFCEDRRQQKAQEKEKKAMKRHQAENDAYLARENELQVLRTKQLLLRLESAKRKAKKSGVELDEFEWLANEFAKLETSCAKAEQALEDDTSEMDYMTNIMFSQG